MKVRIGISARHAHLTKEHLSILFGFDYDLNVYKDLSQYGQYASLEMVTIKTGKGAIDNVRILGPTRSYTQVEISKTDAHRLGINPPVRESGEINDSSVVTLVGPVGEVELKEGCIIASRHIHLTNDDVKRLSLDNQVHVQVKIDGVKGGILDNVSLKVDDSYEFELHLDTDDGNAHLINQGDYGTIIKYEN